MNEIEEKFLILSKTIPGAKFGYLKAQVTDRGPVMGQNITQVAGIFVGDPIAPPDYVMMGGYFLFVPNKIQEIDQGISPEDFLENIPKFRK